VTYYQFGFEDEGVYLPFDIASLVAYRDLRTVQRGSASSQFSKQPNWSKQTYLTKSGKIDQGEVEHFRAVYPQGHALVLARDAERLLFGLVPDLGEVDKAVCEVEELAPLVATSGVDQLEDKRAARHDSLAAREEVAPDDASECVNR
jgi:hypothetical protein